MNDNLPRAIIAGIARGSYQRCGWRPRRGGWSIRVLPGQDLRRGDLGSIWKRVLNEWDKGPDAGIHLLLAHDMEDERPEFHELKCWSCRASWLPRELSNRYGSDAFSQAIDEFLSFEEEWRYRLRPSLNSPLLLPKSAFSADPSVKDTWKRVRTVNRQRDDIEAVERSVARFNDRHRRNGVWCDSRELEFRHGVHHGYHGLSSWRKQKFTFHFPDGFHFDVKHYRDRKFSLDDRKGKLQQFARYTNIDPHGFTRGGF